MTALKQAAVWALLLAAGAAQAEIFRCKQANGAVAYQDTPCASGEQRKIEGPATARHPPPAPEGLTAQMAAEAAEYNARYAEAERRRLVRETVEEVRNQDGQGAQPAPPRRICPTEHDIRKIEVDISSIRNRDNQRLQTELRRQLRDAKACQ